MSTRREWIEGLVGEVDARKRRVKELENRALPTMDKLHSAFQADIDDINTELKDDEALILFTTGPLSFHIRHDDSGKRIELSLQPDDEVLMYEDTYRREHYLFAMADKDGGITFFENQSNRMVTPEQLSQRLVDLLVREAYKVPKKQR